MIRSRIKMGCLTQSVHSDANGAFGCQCSGHFPFEQCWSLPNETGLVKQPVLWSVVLGPHGLEKSLFSSEDLNGGCGMLGQVQKTSGMGDQLGPNQFPDQNSQIGADCVHPILQVFLETGSVLIELNDLVSQLQKELLVFFTDFRAHGDLCGLFDFLFDFLCQQATQVLIGCLVPHPDLLDHFGVSQVVRDDLGQLWEVVAVPLTKSHHVVVDLLVEILQKGNSLDDHRVDFVARDLQLVAGEPMCQSQ